MKKTSLITLVISCLLSGTSFTKEFHEKKNEVSFGLGVPLLAISNEENLPVHIHFNLAYARLFDRYAPFFQIRLSQHSKITDFDNLRILLESGPEVILGVKYRFKLNPKYNMELRPLISYGRGHGTVTQEHTKYSKSSTHVNYGILSLGLGYTVNLKKWLILKVELTTTYIHYNHPDLDKSARSEKLSWNIPTPEFSIGYLF